MDLSAINKVAKMAEFLPTKKLVDLDVQHDYPVNDMKFVQTKFGRRIVAELCGEFVVFLPARLVKAFEADEELFNTMVEASHDGQLYMNYFGGKYNSVEFKRL